MRDERTIKLLCVKLGKAPRKNDEHKCRHG